MIFVAPELDRLIRTCLTSRWFSLFQLKEACPPHKISELDKLVKSLKGDEAKIRAAISAWWDEPVTPVEEEWEDVNKRTHHSNAKSTKPTAGRGGAGRGRSEGRGGRSEGRGRGRGDRAAGRDGGRGRGRDASTRSRSPDATKPQNGKKGEKTEVAAVPAVVPPIGNIRAPQGAWAKKAEAAAAATAPIAPPQPKVEEPAPLSTPVPPTPSREPDPVISSPASLAPSTQTTAPPARSGGNVWATMGSAHLIRAELPKPPAPPAPPASFVPSAASPPRVQHVAPAPSMPTPPPPVQQSIAPSPPAQASIAPAPAPVTAPAAWGESAKPPVELPIRSTVEHQAVKPRAPKPPQKPANVLNMGHWETADADDNNLDFGFGSFGNDNDGPSLDTGAEGSAPVKEPSNPPPAVAASPARPPPGLSIGGMPPIPANAVLVHELENKLEEATLNTQPPVTSHDNQMTFPSQSAPSEYNPAASPYMPPPQQGYGGQYGMGMYNYTNSGFPGAAPAGPILSTGIHHQEPKPDQIHQPQQPPPPSLYGNPGSAPSSGNAPGAVTTAPGATESAQQPGMPPGMPSMPYGNPALYYGQQPFHMGQHQGGIGYNYGYGGQFAGAVQGSFGYPQSIQQGTGYPSHYGDDQAHTGATNVGGGYQQKNNGGYRGRNQYQSHNQYPQGGYGGQPQYGMGYQQDFRGGYGGMQDPYGLQQQPQAHQQIGGDDQHRGRKGGRGGGGSLPQFQQPQQQQGPPPQLGQQQPFGMQGQTGGNANQSTGWSNQQTGGARGGWNAGAASWQGK